MSLSHFSETRRRAIGRSVAALACSLGVMRAFAQDPGPLAATGELAALAQQLIEVIATFADYGATSAPPPIFEMPQHVLEERICEQPCNVTAAYVPREGIYLSAHLNPVREPIDRAVLLHELVHYLQQGHPKFAHLSGCARERAKEQEAYAIHNAYLASLGSNQRVTLYDGELDC